VKRLISSMIGLFRRGTSSFTSFERCVLDAIANELTDTRKESWEARIRAVNLVQRLDGAREINCYSMRGGKPLLDKSRRVLDVAGECKLAVVAIRGAAGTANVVDVWLVDGLLFSLEFRWPTEHADPLSITSIEVNLASTACEAS
jgi:hypothetical protein